jgi:predicted nucleotidyltransferase component of viral defense system
VISIAEVQRIAGSLGMSPAVVNHDYVLGCFLHFLSIQSHVRRSWLFKGGTSLQKCHFGTYRFSEDLDFTVLEAITVEGIRAIADRAKTAMQDSIGIRTDEVATRIDVMNDDYGHESFEARIYYRGPWNYGGSSKSLQIHLSRNELVAFPAQDRQIVHSYSDRDILPKASVRVYSLEETLVEKLRALSGQRRHAIARDVFDLFFLLTHGVDEGKAIAALSDKLLIKGIDMESIRIDTTEARRADFELNWTRNLEYLLPDQLKVPFGDAWDRSIALLKRALAEGKTRTAWTASSP